MPRKKPKFNSKGKLLTPSGCVTQAKPVFKIDKKALFDCVVSAILSNRVLVVIVWPSSHRLPQGMPRSRKYEVVGENSESVVKATKLLAWLNKVGYTQVTLNQIKAYKGYMTKLIDSIG